MEAVEQPDVAPTSPFGGVDDVGDPSAPGESSTKAMAQDEANMSMGPSPIGLVEQALGPPSVPQPRGSRAGGSVQLQRVPRDVPPLLAAVEEVEEIERKATPPPQLVRIAIHRGDELEMLD